MNQPALAFDRATDTLLGASTLERAAAMAFRAGARTSAMWSYRGYGAGCRLVRSLLAPRDIEVRLNDDALFAFPYGDGYWSLLLDPKFRYESDIEALFVGIADADYTLIDCGANFGYWSVLASSRPFGAHRAVAIEPSAQNYARLSHNAVINGNRFTTLKRAIGETRGTAILSGAKHEQLSIAGSPQVSGQSSAVSGGEAVEVIALDHLIDDGVVDGQGRYVIKLDVEGVEIEAMKGGMRLMQTDCLMICEDHGSDRQHTVSRYILEHTAMKLYVYDPRSRRFELMSDVDALNRIKQFTNVGYNVLATASPFWEQRIQALGLGPANTDR